MSLNIYYIVISILAFLLIIKRTFIVKFLKNKIIKNEILKKNVKNSVIYDEFQKKLSLKKSQCLDISEIKPFIEIIISDDELCDFVRNKMKIFDKYYIDHFIKNHKHFVRMNNIDSFATSLLYHIYH